MRIFVICTKCEHHAPYDPPDFNHPWGVWHWHEPCPHCGANSWVTVEVGRDWKTGKLLKDIPKQD